jgi:hypothetical protein
MIIVAEKVGLSKTKAIQIIQEVNEIIKSG